MIVYHLSTMPQPDPVRIDVNGTSITARLHRPESTGDAPVPAVLMCGGYAVNDEDTHAFQQQVAEILSEVGFAVATFEPRPISAEYGAAGTVDDASAVFRWLLLQDGLDPQRIGVLGYSSASLVAAGLAARTDNLAGVCLLAPMLAEDVANIMMAAVDSDKNADSTPALDDATLRSLEAMTPIDDIAVHDRPTLIVHPAADRVVLADRSAQFAARLESAAHDVDHMLIARCDHGFTNLEGRVACLEQIVNFFSGMPARTSAA